eukprot:gene15237-18021_t
MIEGNRDHEPSVMTSRSDVPREVALVKSRWTVASDTRGANKSGALRATRESMLTVLLRTEVWDFVIDPLFTPTDNKALLRMTCECMRDQYREFVSLQAPETLSATPSLFRFTVGTDPRHFDFDWLRCACALIAGRGQLDML